MIPIGRIFLASIPILISLTANKWRVEDEAKFFAEDIENFNLPVNDTFDFIVVGAGSSGCVLAAVLSEKFSVLLLEAGGRPPALVNVPLISNQISELPDINFRFVSTEQQRAGREDNGILTASAGRMLGGSGSHNEMTFGHGHPKDYDRWAMETGDLSWGHKNVLKYMRQIENYQGVFKNHGKRGTSGPVDIVEDPYYPGVGVWLDAGKELGYDHKDPNGGVKNEFFAQTQFTKRKGHRANAYTAFIEGKETRNLKILTYSPVSRVLFDGTKAVGVEYERHGVARAAFASKETIISAGAVISPIILFKSGIGPADQVKAAKAERHIVDLPVGKNLLNHPAVRIGPVHLDDPNLLLDLNDLTMEDFQNYTKNGQGPLTTSLRSLEAYIMSKRDQPFGGANSLIPRKLLTWPDLEIQFGSGGMGKIILTRPLSTGTLTFNPKASSMLDDQIALLDFNLFAVPSDMDVLVEGIKFFLKVIEETKSFKNVGARSNVKPLTACKREWFRSDGYWKCYLRQRATVMHHYAGTCRMGMGSLDPRAVVDSKLRVIGVQNLRVCDSSVMPYLPNGRCFGPVMVIGKKTADDILMTYNKK